MAIEHVDCPEADIHNPKGFSTASNDSVLTKNSSGVLTWELKTALQGDVPHGNSYISSSAATTISVAGTYYKAAGTWTNTEADGMTWDTDHFVIVTAGDYIVHATGNVQGTNGEILGVDINKGSTIADANKYGQAPARVKMSTVGDIQNFHVAYYLTSLTAGDKITVLVTDEDGTNNVTVTQCHLYLQYLHA